MARRFNGTSDYIDFTVSTAIQSQTGGTFTMVAVCKPNDTTDGALVHARTSGGTNCWWMEIFGGNWNYGTGTTARDVGDVNTTDGWYVLIGRKAGSGSAQPRGRKIILGGSTTDVTAASGLVDGSAPGSGGILRVGRWGTSTDYLSADIAAVAVFTSDISDSTAATLTTYANILAAGPAWVVAFDQANAADAIDDDSSNGGGDSTTINGTTIVSDPSGFFGSGPSTVDLTTASVVLSAVALNPVPQPVTISLAPAILAFSAVSVSPVPGVVTTNLTPAALVLSAIAVTPVPQPVTIALAPAVMSFGAVAVTPVPQPVTVALTPAIVAFSAVPVTPVPGQVTTALTPAVLALTAVPLGVGGVGTVALTPAVLSFGAVALDPDAQPVTINLAPAVLVFSAVGVVVVPQSVTINFVPAVLSFVALRFFEPITNEVLPPPIKVSVPMSRVRVGVPMDVVPAHVPMSTINVVA